MDRSTNFRNLLDVKEVKLNKTGVEIKGRAHMLKKTQEVAEEEFRKSKEKTKLHKIKSRVNCLRPCLKKRNTGVSKSPQLSAGPLTITKHHSIKLPKIVDLALSDTMVRGKLTESREKRSRINRTL